MIHGGPGPGAGGVFVIQIKLLGVWVSSAKETKTRDKWCWSSDGFWGNAAGFAKVDRGKEHSLLMHQCTTEVLCNLAGLIFGLAFTLPRFF